jgi:hypothetical protein
MHAPGLCQILPPVPSNALCSHNYAAPASCQVKFVEDHPEKKEAADRYADVSPRALPACHCPARHRQALPMYLHPDRTCLSDSTGHPI